MPFAFSVPSLNGQTEISIEPGSSVVFVGANGGGKTRLAVYIESVLALNAHRISAHRALTLNPGISKISERDALSGLRTGHSDEKSTLAYREGSRWHHKGATWLLNDFDFLVQALFADQMILSLKTHQRNRNGDHSVADPTKFESLVTIWERLLPDLQLHISGDNIQASVCGSEEYYTASDMSDGERAIFYMIGQTLAAASNSILIFDEPELHVHSSEPSALEALKNAAEKFKDDELNEDLARDCACKAWHLCDHVYQALGSNPKFSSVRKLQENVKDTCRELAYLQDICIESKHGKFTHHTPRIDGAKISRRRLRPG